MDQNADITGGQMSPVIRFCRRPTDGHKLLKLVFAHATVDLSGNIQNRMLEEAVKRGSATTVEVL